MFSITGPLANDLLALHFLGAIMAAFWIGKRFSLLSGALFLYMAFSSFRIFLTGSYPLESPEWRASLSLAASSALLLVCFVVFLSVKIKPRLFSISAQCIALINSVFLIFDHVGLLHNASMSGCLSAVILPLFFCKKGRAPFVPIILIPLSILLSGQSQPIALLFLEAGLFLLARKEWKLLLAAIIASVSIGALACGHALFDSSGRTALWKDVFEFFGEHSNPWLGMGLGSFYFIGPFLTVQKFGQAFLSLHSDWFQLLFETGIVGAALSALVFIECIYKARKNEMLRTSLIASGAWGIANFPLHAPLSALFIACLFSRAYFEKVQASTHKLRPNSQA